MAQVLVRNLSPKTVRRLKKKAKHHSRSLQEELKTILEAASEVSDDPAEVARRIRESMRKLGVPQTDSAILLAEDRSR
jgi:plasmid stability protein